MSVRQSLLNILATEPGIGFSVQIDARHGYVRLLFVANERDSLPFAHDRSWQSRACAGFPHRDALASL